MIHLAIHAAVVLSVVAVSVITADDAAGWISPSRLMCALAGAEVFCWSFLNVLTRSYGLFMVKKKDAWSEVVPMTLGAFVMWAIGFCMVGVFVPTLLHLAVFFGALIAATFTAAALTRQFSLARRDAEALAVVG